MLPLNAFNKLRSGMTGYWKNSVLSTKSQTHLTRRRQNSSRNVWQQWLYSGDQLYAGYQAYQPVTAPAGRSYVARVKTNITSA